MTRSATWLTAVYAGSAAAMGLVIWAAFSGWMPVFFIEGQGGTPLRSLAVGAAVALFVLTAGLLWQTNRRIPSPFLYWYALGLILLAAGLAGSMVIAVKGLIVPEDRDRVMATIRSGRASSVEHAALCKDGTRIVVESHGRPVFPGGARRHTAIRDITERKQAEDALRDLNVQLENRVQQRTAEVRVASLYARRLIEASLDPLVTISAEGKITDVNDASVQAIGVSREDILGAFWGGAFWGHMTN